jgi:hypothetical protein
MSTKVKNTTSSQHDAKLPVSGSVFLMVVRWFEKMFCKHKNKTEIFRCYQDRYVSEVCNNCGKVIYSDL